MIIMTAVIVTANASAIVVSHHHHSVLFWVLLVESLLIISESLPCSMLALQLKTILLLDVYQQLCCLQGL
jgi:hypothetical protein